MKDQIQKLRKITGAGVMECKRALDQSGGDFQKAKKVVYEKGLAKAAGKEGKETGAGLIYAYVHNERIGVLLKAGAETDFAVKSEQFREFVHDLAMQIAAMDPASVGDLLDQLFVKDESKKVKDVMNEVIAKIGENIEIKKFCRYES